MGNRSSNNLNFPFVDKEKVLAFYPAPSEMYPSIYNATSAMWRDAHMLCLASNLGNWRTAALGLPVWRYRFDLVADNLNSRGSAIGAFHGNSIDGLSLFKSILTIFKAQIFAL